MKQIWLKYIQILNNVFICHIDMNRSYTNFDTSQTFDTQTSDFEQRSSWFWLRTRTFLSCGCHKQYIQIGSTECSSANKYRIDKIEKCTEEEKLFIRTMSLVQQGILFQAQLGQFYN